MKVKIGKEHTTIKFTNRQGVRLLEYLDELRGRNSGNSDLCYFVSDLHEAYKNPVQSLSGNKPHSRPHWNK